MGKWQKYRSLWEISADYYLDMQEVDLLQEIFRRYWEFTIYPGNNIYADIPTEQEGDADILGVLYHIHSTHASI